MNLVGPSRNIIYIIYFLFVGDFSFIRGCRKYECTCFKKQIKHVSIVSWEWKLLGAPIKVYEFVLPSIC